MRRPPITCRRSSRARRWKISAGYVGNYGLIFQGQGWYGIKGRESPTDTTLQLFAKDGRLAYEYAVANKTLQAGSTPKDHVNAIVGAMSKFGVSAGYIPQISSPRSYPRGVALFGMARDLLRTVANTNNCLWSIQMGQVQMTPIGGGVPGGATTLNATTGMIGMPTQTPNGIMVRCLINPAINLGSGSLIQLNNADIQLSQLSPQYGTDAVNASLQSAINSDGRYRIYHIEATADSRGNDWYQDLTCFNADLPPPNASPDLLAAQPNTGGN